jgi:hypothetical protein
LKWSAPSAALAMAPVMVPVRARVLVPARAAARALVPAQAQGRA